MTAPPSLRPAGGTTSKRLWFGFATLTALLLVSGVAIMVQGTVRFALLVLLAGVAIAVGTSVMVTRGVIRGERELRRSREHLRVTFASIGDAVISTDIDGRITFLNAVAEEMTGWTQAEAERQPLDVVFRIIDQQSRQAVESPAARLLRDGVIVGLGHHRTLIARNGTERSIDHRAAPIRNENGEVIGCVLTFRGISEREKSNEAVRASETRNVSMVRASLDAIITIDAKGTVVEFNPAAESLFGYSDAEVIGKELRDLIIPTHLMHEYLAAMARYLATGEGLTLNKRLEMPALRKDGSEIVAELAITRLEGSDPPLFSWFLRDITQEKASEARTTGLLSELRDVDRHKTEFLAILAHELRGCLAPMMNSLELMSLGAVNPDLMHKARSIMARQMSVMQRLIDDLLDTWRISGGKLELRLQRVELAAILDHAVEAALALFESSKHKLTISMPPEPIGLRADPVRLTQVFSNLLNNACKYTEPGGHIWLTVERQGSDAVVSVKDSGVGIAPNVLPRVFEMFMQLDRSLERARGGLGIGLTLVKRLVDMHGGSVEAHSVGQGHGSEFIVRLPTSVASDGVNGCC